MAVAQLVRAPGCGPGGRGFEFRRPPQYAFVAQLAEQLLHTEKVVGSSPIKGTTELLSLSILWAGMGIAWESEFIYSRIA